ncbi:MAG: apolipoprotein N-acyltransferase [Candidatus Omnitrophota bacterium]
MTNSRKILTKTFLASATAALLALSFPGFNVWVCAWFALIPLFVALEGLSPLRAFVVAYGAGILFYFGTVYWLIHVTMPGMITVVLYLGLYFGVFGSFFALIRPLRLSALAVVPSAWVALEYLRAHLFSGFGWALLGYSQTNNLPMIQIADMFGGYGVSFLIVMVNAGLYQCMREMRPPNSASAIGKPMRPRRLFAPLVVAGACVAATFVYGVCRLNTIFVGETLKISIVQGNIPQCQKWDRRFREEIIGTYERLTREAAGDDPDLIIWPETAVPGLLASGGEFDSRLASLAKEVAKPILVGAPRIQNNASYNSAFLFMNNGTIAGRYDKIKLVPFGEYLPFKKIFSFVKSIAPIPIGDFSSGSERTVFTIDRERRTESDERIVRVSKRVKFSSLICFEDIFPEAARSFRAEGAQFLVNITNDAWFLEGPAAYQHAQASVFRAIETRTNVVRAANTGLSCFIDQAGRIRQRVSRNGEDLFVEGFSTQRIVLANTGSFFMEHGDVFAAIAAYIALLWAIFEKVRRKTA